MSMSECERFVADLQSNEALRAEAEKHAAELGCNHTLEKKDGTWRVT